MLFHAPSKIAYIIVGLGNPGKKYDNTRHNAGFMALDVLSGEYGEPINRLKFKSLTATCVINEKKCLLLKPQTFMNVSGEAVAQAMQFYKVPLDHVIVIFDDISLSPSKLRIRRSGSAGGHNGIKSIISLCGGEDFPRIKLGVGSDANEDLADFVLSTFSSPDKKLFDSAVSNVKDIVEHIVNGEMDAAMNLYNIKR